MLEKLLTEIKKGNSTSPVVLAERLNLSTALANHCLKIGGGIGYHHQTISGLTYLTGGLTRKIQLDIQSGLEPTVTFQYQYCFRNKWIIGAEYTLINTDGYDAVKLLLGIRL
jgi:hypothetical protein